MKSFVAELVSYFKFLYNHPFKVLPVFDVDQQIEQEVSVVVASSFPCTCLI